MRTGYLIPAALAVSVLAAACGGQASAPVEPAKAAVPAPTVGELPAPYNEANLEAGQALFGNKCSACHYIDNRKDHKVGPTLHGMFERGPGKAPGYPTYSVAVKGLGGETWDPAVLDQWLANPRAFLPGSNMFFNGLTDARQRRDLIAYLMVQSRK
jgi:cytochrome c